MVANKPADQPWMLAVEAPINGLTTKFMERQSDYKGNWKIEGRGRIISPNNKNFAEQPANKKASHAHWKYMEARRGHVVRYSGNYMQPSLQRQVFYRRTLVPNK